MLRYICPHELAVAGSNKAGVLSRLVVQAVLVDAVVVVQEVVPRVRSVRQSVVGALLEAGLCAHLMVIMMMVMMMVMFMMVVMSDGDDYARTIM